MRRSIAKYVEAVETEDEGERKSSMDEILKYNEEDLKATWAVSAEGSKNEVPTV